MSSNGIVLLGVNRRFIREASRTQEATAEAAARSVTNIIAPEARLAMMTDEQQPEDPPA